MNGHICVESTVGQGSAFEVVLPLTRLSATPPSRDETPATRAAAMRALRAEDNETNRLVISTLLDQVGVEAELTNDGSEALSAWEAGAWDLVLMDIQMPQMDGLEATRRIRVLESERGRPRTPILALTANAMHHQVEEYLSAGFDGVVAKPIQVSRLVEAMENVLVAGEARHEDCNAAVA